MVAFRKFNNFRNFGELSKEIVVTFAPISKVLGFFVEWKAPLVNDETSQPENEAEQWLNLFAFCFAA